MQELTGKVAVVTGAASGIGKALCHLFAAEGMAVVMADVEEGALETAADDLAGEGAKAIGVPTDVADAQSVQALADEAVRQFGTVHVVCNNAGVSGTFARTWMTTPEDWKWVLDVNVWGVINGIRSFLPILLEQNEGHVVSTGSAACFEAFPGMGAYAASKHAILGISESLRREMAAAGANVGVSVYIPGGTINTRILESERNWPARLGPVPERDPDPLTNLVRTNFAHLFATGVDPKLTAGAVIDGIRANTFVVSDDPEILAVWGAHHADIAKGEPPAWPPG